MLRSPGHQANRAELQPQSRRQPVPPRSSAADRRPVEVPNHRWSRQATPSVVGAAARFRRRRLAPDPWRVEPCWRLCGPTLCA